MSDDKKDYYGEEAFSHLPSDYKPSVTPDKAPRRWPMFELVQKHSRAGARAHGRS